MKLFRIYFDALNFYYRVLKPCGINWLDVKAYLLYLLQTRVPDAEIEKIFYYTSRLSGNAGDKQKDYIQALMQHYPSVIVPKYGKFKKVVKNGVLLEEYHKKIEKVSKFVVNEEKGTDVNIACDIVKDSYTAAGKEFEYACLVTNDSDLLYPMKHKLELGQEMFVMAPNISRYSNNKHYGAVSAAIKDLVPEGYLITHFNEGKLRSTLLPEKVRKSTLPKRKD